MQNALPSKSLLVLSAVFCLVLPVQAEEPHLVAAFLPLTGPAAYVGNELREGMQLAVENEESSVRVLFEDSKTSAADAVSAMHALEAREAPLAYVSALSTISLAMAPIAEERRVPLIATVVSTPQLTPDRHWTFKLFPSAKDEVDALRPLITSLLSPSFGFLYLEDDFGNSVKEELDKIGHESGRPYQFESFLLKETDFRPYLLRLNQRGVRTLYLAGLDAHLRNIVLAVSSTGFQGRLLGTSPFSFPKFRNDLGHALDGVTCAAPLLYKPGNEAAQQFVSRFETKFHHPPTHYAAAGFDTMQWISVAITLSKKPTRAALRDTLASYVPKEAVLGAPIVEGDGRERGFSLVAATIQAGALDYH